MAEATAEATAEVTAKAMAEATAKATTKATAEVIRESSLLDLPRGICFSDVPRKPNIWLGKHTGKLCPLACLI
jgi:hypothetical protein